MNIIPATSVELTRAIECALSVCLGHEDMREWTLADFSALVITPISMGHCFFATNEKDEVVALMTWAFLDEDGVTRLLNGEPLLACDWEAGQAFWIIDFIAPFGNVRSILRGLRERAPRGMPVNWRRVPSGCIDREERLGQFTLQALH